MKATYPKHTEAEAKCIACSHRWWVKANEIRRDDMPICPECFGIGVSTGKAREVRDELKEGKENVKNN